ncbi:MAG TPA: A24 family peptidase [Verrucomicrobiae bacterium]|nr:A24 family peptidase [Verrucomicrobiae bacterium]
MTWLIQAAAILGVCSAVADVRRRSIPNWLTASGVVAGLAGNSVAAGWLGLALATAGAAVGFVLLLPLQMKGTMGGGDVKLMAAFGALLGPAGILLTGLLAAVAGGVWTALWLVLRPRSRAVPYAPAIVLGAWLSCLGGRAIGGA